MKKIVLMCAVVLLVVSCSQNKTKPGSNISVASDATKSVNTGNNVDINISADILERYKGVVIAVTDKKSKKTIEKDVLFGVPSEVEGTNMVLEAHDFLPDFRMDGKKMYTASLDANNVAVNLHVTGITPEYEGWLFFNMPDVHAYNGPEYDIKIVGVVVPAGTEKAAKGK